MSKDAKPADGVKSDSEPKKEPVQLELPLDPGAKPGLKGKFRTMNGNIVEHF